MTAAALRVVDGESAALVRDESTPPTSHAAKLNWLRTGVIGANHGIISTTGLVVGVDGQDPGPQVLDIQTKLISHAIRIAAFNTATALARDVRVHTGYARANHEAHTLIRQALTGSGDIDPGDGTLTVRLAPLPTSRATAAIAQLCEHLTATQTRYPGTNLILRYEVKTHP
jgi:hypothetical protein